MAHNQSRQKRDEAARAARAKALAPFLEPGWRIDRIRGEIVAIDTVLASYQRGQTLLLWCRRADCRRRCEVDLKAAIKAGLGERPLRDVIGALRCQHWEGCAIEENGLVYPGGVPIVHYLNDDDAMIGIECTNCRKRTLLAPAEVIRRLKESRGGDGNTGIIALGKVIRGPCRKCGASEFATRPETLRKALGPRA